MPEINVNTLELILVRLIDKLRKQNVNEFSFEEDWYWCVPLDELSSSPEQPNLTIGSLEDDIDYLKSTVNEDYLTDFLELERLAVLFRFMNKKLNPLPS